MISRRRRSMRRRRRRRRARRRRRDKAALTSLLVKLTTLRDVWLIRAVTYVFRDTTPCSSVEAHRHFRRSGFLHNYVAEGILVRLHVYPNFNTGPSCGIPTLCLLKLFFFKHKPFLEYSRHLTFVYLLRDGNVRRWATSVFAAIVVCSNRSSGTLRLIPFR